MGGRYTVGLDCGDLLAVERDGLIAAEALAMLLEERHPCADARVAYHPEHGVVGIADLREQGEE